MFPAVDQEEKKNPLEDLNVFQMNEHLDPEEQDASCDPGTLQSLSCCQRDVWDSLWKDFTFKSFCCTTY